MIDPQSNQLAWISDLRNKLGNRIDPKLIEKVIWALTLLEQLTLNGLSFTFKGGTALLLATKEPKRFSIDIDIITENKESEILQILEKLVRDQIFISTENDSDRKHTPDAPLGHYKVYYKSQVDGHIEPILLDTLYTPNPYPEVRQIPIAHPWILNRGEATMVQVPTYESILGDKLTAFAPNTTGIIYTKNRPVEIIKQLFDIEFLFDNIQKISEVKASYLKVVKEEIGFRNLKIEATEVLEDTLNTCYKLAERNAKDVEFEQLQKGIKNFTNFTIQRFGIEESITAAAKTAYLTQLLQTEKPIERYTTPQEIKDWTITNPKYAKLQKLKKNNPEAYYYWHQALTTNQQV